MPSTVRCRHTRAISLMSACAKARKARRTHVRRGRRVSSGRQTSLTGLGWIDGLACIDPVILLREQTGNVPHDNVGVALTRFASFGASLRHRVERDRFADPHFKLGPLA